LVRDKRSHYKECPRAGEEEDEEILESSEDSINGICGL
jgi:hypothetical protein